MKLLRKCVKQTLHPTGSPLRQVPPQHRRLHPGEGVQPEEPEDHTQAGQANVR